ncbi:MAG TPA: hypothetical protein VNN77_05375 [candidate division Zixibacteria bacterium]|nr:hypothetical protein [candidate division Zixibacteria bacterium]
MRSLQVIRAKPNPTGKDRHGPYIPPKQLAAEWVDFKNDGTETFPLSGISLQHIAYQPGCRNGKWDKVMGFQGDLGVGQVIRVHSGGEIPLSQMNAEDAQGADFHLFTGKNYIWNNDCGDSAGLWNGNAWVDKASYDPHPPEGRILRRVGNKLVP